MTTTNQTETLTANETALINIEKKVYGILCSVEGTLNKAEADRLYELRQLCGKKYDVACRVWRSL